MPAGAEADRWVGDSRTRGRVVDDFDSTTVTTPTTIHGLHRVTQGFGVLHVELSADGVVEKGSNRRGLHHVETGQISTGGAAVAGRHPFTVGVSQSLCDRYS